MPKVSTPLGRWHFDVHGKEASSGDPGVVLLHGLMLDRRMWADQVDALQLVGRVLAFDGPGHGLSEPAPPFTLETQADALADALREIGVERAVLVGHGWGGLVALRFALQHPDRAAGIVVMGASPDRESPRKRRSRRALLERVKGFGIPRWLVRARLAPMLYEARVLRERPELADELHQALNARPRQGLVRAAEAILDRTSVAARLGRVSSPALVVCGQRDRTTNVSESELLARRIPGARLVRLDAGHTPPVERPGRMCEVLLPFVRACVDRRRRPAAEASTGARDSTSPFSTGAPLLAPLRDV